MGDRRIAVIHFPPEYGADLAVYTHWGGSELEEDVAKILESNDFKSRLGDHTYAARILVDQLTASARDEATGYGLFPLAQFGANPEHFAESTSPIVHIDLVTGTVMDGSKV